MNFSAFGKSSNKSSLNLSWISRSDSLGERFKVIFKDQSGCTTISESWIQENDLPLPISLYFKSEHEHIRVKILSKADISEAKLNNLHEVLQTRIQPFLNLCKDQDLK